MTAPRFALIGAAGFVAPRHLEAIKSVGGKLVAALDPHDAVGVLDRFDRETEFFTEPERFERHLELLRREGTPVDWVSICSPNYLHDSHIRMALRSRARVICEKPLVVEPHNLDALSALEDEYGDWDGDRTERIFTVLQLRHTDAAKALKTEYANGRHAFGRLTYRTPRGLWYHRSWKGAEEKSGGLIMNIGVHMFDLLIHVFGPVRKIGQLVNERTFFHGDLHFNNAQITCTLTTDGDVTERDLSIDAKQWTFTGFENLHNTVYAETLAGRGHGIEDARLAIELAARLRRISR